MEIVLCAIKKFSLRKRWAELALPIEVILLKARWPVPSKMGLAVCLRSGRWFLILAVCGCLQHFGIFIHSYRSAFTFPCSSVWSHLCATWQKNSPYITEPFAVYCRRTAAHTIGKLPIQGTSSCLGDAGSVRPGLKPQQAQVSKKPPSNAHWTLYIIRSKLIQITIVSCGTYVVETTILWAISIHGAFLGTFGFVGLYKKVLYTTM